MSEYDTPPQRYSRSVGSRVLVALGANIGEPISKFDETIAEIGKSLCVPLQVSPYYRTKPLRQGTSVINQPEQPDFLNCVVQFRSFLPATDLFKTLQDIELRMGRTRSKKVVWGPRIIDIDLLSVGDQIIKTDGLALPHPEIHNRDFVLYPIRDVARDFTHPISKLTIDELIYNYHARGLPSLITGIISDHVEPRKVSGSDIF